MPTIPRIIQTPQPLDDKLKLDAAAESVSVQAVILRILSEHYGIAFVPPKRGRPWPKNNTKKEGGK